jgi:CRISPR system Cascade subunit CasE
MFLSCLLVDTGENPDRPRPGRLWLRNLYRVHQRLCMGFPSAVRVAEDDLFLQPFRSEDFSDGQIHVARDSNGGFLYRVDPRPPGRAVILVQSAIEPDWSYAFRNAKHLLASDPQVRVWNPSFSAGMRLCFRLQANTIRRLKSSEPNQLGPRVSIPPTPEAMQDWLSRRAEIAGFQVDALTAAVPGFEYVNKSVTENQGIRFRSVRYEGSLTVVEAEKFRQAVESGIGPAKSFGFGLLSVAPARA